MLITNICDSTAFSQGLSPSGYTMVDRLNITDTRFDNMKSSPLTLRRFLQLQGIYLGVAVIGTAVFWAIGQPINPVTVLVYSLCIGNLIQPPMNRVRREYGQRPVP